MPGPSLTSLDDPAGLSPVLIAPVPPQFPPDTPPGLRQRFRESYDWFNYGGFPVLGAGGPLYLQTDDAPNWPAGLYRGQTGTVGDRKAGKDLPRFWSELDLRGYRVMSRWLWETNPFMIGFGRALTDYHIGKGWQWQACKKGQKKQAYATGSATADPVVTKAQNVLDAWRDRVGWPLRSREGFRRLHRDGEVIQHFFRADRGELPEVRWVNSEQVGSPGGDTNGDGSFGVETKPGDTEYVTRLFIRDHDGDGSAGAWVNADRFDPAARVVFFKTNTDSDVKRGLPDSFSVHESLDECRKLVRNMVVVACAQSAISWVEKFPTASAEQVRALIPTGNPRLDVPGWGNGVGETVYSEKMAAGTVLRTEGSREFAAGPTSTAVPNYVEAEQAALRMACVRWGFPPYLTAKADDINFASSLTAGSPFAVAVEGGQIEWGAVERATALKVLDLAAESGLLTAAERAHLDVEVTAPSVTSPDKKADTDRLLGLLDKKVVDPYTVQQELGYDPSHIEANWEAYEKRAARAGADGQELKGTVAGLSAVQQLQTAVYGGQVPKEAAAAAMVILFGFDPGAAAKLFPDAKPVDQTQQTPPAGGPPPGQPGPPPDPFAPPPAGPPSLESARPVGHPDGQFADPALVRTVADTWFRPDGSPKTRAMTQSMIRDTMEKHGLTLRGAALVFEKALLHYRPEHVTGGSDAYWSLVDRMEGDDDYGPAAESVSEATPTRLPDAAHVFAAMLRAAAEDDHDAVSDLADLAADPAELARVVRGVTGEVEEGWTAFTTAKKTTAAVSDSGAKVYGARARAVLAAQHRQARGEPDPEKPHEKAARLKAEREPSREEARKTFAAALADPAAVRPEHLDALRVHLHALTRDEARARLKELGAKAGGKLKADIVEGLLDHVRGKAGAATAPPAAATPPLPTIDLVTAADTHQSIDGKKYPTRDAAAAVPGATAVTHGSGGWMAVAPAAATPAAVARPVAGLDDAGFAAAVQTAADENPTAFGHTSASPKVLIAHVFNSLHAADPTLTRAEFDRRLLDAHRTGRVELSRADLVQLLHPDDVADSEVNHLTGSYHFVKVPADRDRGPTRPRGDALTSGKQQAAMRADAEAKAARGEPLSDFTRQQFPDLAPAPAAPRAAKPPTHPAWVAADPRHAAAADHYARATGAAKTVQETALDNAGYLARHPKTDAVTGFEPEPGGDDQHRNYVTGLASGHRQMIDHGLGGPGDRQQVEDALAAAGAERLGAEGETVAFDRAHHEDGPGLSTGDRVRVVKPGWAIPLDADRQQVPVKAAVERVGESGDSPEIASTGIDRTGRVGDTPRTRGRPRVGGAKMILDTSKFHAAQTGSLEGFTGATSLRSPGAAEVPFGVGDIALLRDQPWSPPTYRVPWSPAGDYHDIPAYQFGAIQASMKAAGVPLTDLPNILAAAHGSGKSAVATVKDHLAGAVAPSRPPQPKNAPAMPTDPAAPGHEWQLRTRITDAPGPDEGEPEYRGEHRWVQARTEAAKAEEAAAEAAAGGWGYTDARAHPTDPGVEILRAGNRTAWGETQSTFAHPDGHVYEYQPRDGAVVRRRIPATPRLLAALREKHRVNGTPPNGAA